MATVRYLVDDIDAAIAFYEGILGFDVIERMGRPFAILTDGDLTLWLSGPGTSAWRPVADGREPVPGGWNRLVVEVRDMEAVVSKLLRTGARFRTEIIASPGGKQVLVEDPAGNLVELTQPL
jgi:catechol 2,3-dioxygenase-like lactoylglutathione lyase family enzyme